ncbi:extracellular solute-binding protein [Baekduia sp.]|uniref:extracellular solute-binding protein n=1 Tax=Baekduia sp. TaxID=2600305 RepID=UPI002D775B24|nr:extracellular solute-binding protein [Baekduia sp.]
MVRWNTAQRCAAMVCAAGAALVGAGCSPGGDAASPTSRSETRTVVTDASKLGQVTITEWDKNTFAGPNQAMKEINARFEQKYPNIKVKRLARAFEDLKTTLKLALSSGTPPDVVQVNQGYGDLVAFTKAALVRPLDPWAEAYGWERRYPATLLAQNRVGDDGTWGTGKLYGVSSTAELVGVYYNKSVLAKAGLQPPTSYPELVEQLAKLKASGVQPIEFGASTKSPTIHLFGTILTSLAGPKLVNDLVFGRDGASWKDPKAVQALTTLGDWAKQGYINKDANGKTEAQAGADFQKGKAAFYVSGSWWGGTFKSSDDVGFVALAPSSGAAPAALGGLGLLWAVTSKSPHPDAAAAYIDYLNGPEAADIIAKSGDLPANQGGAFKSPADSLQGELGSNIAKVLDAGTMAPYLDYATPDFYDVITAQLQQVIAGRTSASQAADALQKEVDSFKSTK